MKKNGSDPAEPETPVMLFSELIESHSNGDIDRFLSEKLSEVIAAVKETQKGGKIVVELSIKPEAAYAKVDVTCKTTIPQPPLPGAIYYFRGDTALSKEDPRQLMINLRDLGGKKPTEIRDTDKKPE